MKASGDAAEFERAQRYAWEAQENHGDTSQHLQANPTAGEYYRRKEKEEAEKKRAEREKALLDKYGGEQKTMPESLRAMALTERENFIEYDEVGLIKGAPKTFAKSKYPEDIYINNHTSVWGSWWSDFRWGYACCHSFVKNSYCTGEEGRRAWEVSERQRAGVSLIEGAPENEPIDTKEDAEEAVEEPKSPKATAKKRTIEEMMSGVSEAELDEYRRKKTVADDPMAKFLGKDELVH